MALDLSNPYTYYLRSPRRLFGRRRILREILEGILRNDGEPPESCSIRGPRAIGKTTLLRFLGEMIETPELLVPYGLDPGLVQERPVRAYYVDLYQISSDRLAKQVMEQIGETWAEDQWEALLHLPPSPRRVLLLDHCDEAMRTMEREHARRLRELTARHVLIIATERDLADLMSRREVLSLLVQVLRPYRLGLLAREEAEELFRQPAREVEIELEPEVVDFFIRALGRHPYLLLLGGEALFDWLQDPERRSRLRADPRLQEEARFRIRMHPAVQDFFDYIWKSISEEERNALGRVLEGQSILPRQRLRLEQAALIEGGEEGLRIFSELFAEEARERLQAPQRPRLEEQLPTLPGLEGQLLKYLRERPGRLCTYTELVHVLWGPQTKTEEKKRALDALIYRVRQRIREATGSHWEYIRNVRGKGYVFTPPPHQP